MDDSINNINNSNIEQYVDNLYKYFTEDRVNMSTFLKQDLMKLEYDVLTNVISRLCKKYDVSVKSLMDGLIGYQHNARLGISIFPTWNLFRIISKIMNNIGLSKLEDIGTGIGLLPFIFKQFNNHNNQILESISGSDPTYSLSSCITLTGINLKDKDICEYITDDGLDENNGYLIVDPYIGLGYNMIDYIQKLCKYRKPKLVVVILDRRNITKKLETEFNPGYRSITLFPKIISRLDTCSYNFNKSSHFKMVLIIREDLHMTINIAKEFESDLFQFNDSVSHMSESEYNEYDNNMDFLHLMIENKKIPEFVKNVDQSMARIIINFISEISNYKGYIPMFLETIEDIDTYIMMYTYAVTYFNKIPDNLNKKLNFDILKKCFDMYNNSNISELRRMHIIPHSVADSEILAFLIADYCFSDKIDTYIFNPYLVRYQTN